METTTSIAARVIPTVVRVVAVDGGEVAGSASGFAIGQGYVVTTAAVCLAVGRLSDASEARVEELHVEIGSTLHRARLVGVDGLINVGLLHVRSNTLGDPGAAWRRGKSRNCKPGDVVMAVGAGRRVQVGTMCNSRGAGVPAGASECCMVGGMAGVEWGSVLVNLGGTVVGRCVGEYAMRRAVKALADVAAKKESPAISIEAARGRYYKFARYTLNCVAVPYEGEYVALGLEGAAAQAAGYRVTESSNVALEPGDVVVALRFLVGRVEKRYVLGTRPDQSCAAQALEKLVGAAVTLEGYARSGEEWERRVECDKRCDLMPWYAWGLSGTNF